MTRISSRAQGDDCREKVAAEEDARSDILSLLKSKAIQKINSKKKASWLGNHVGNHVAEVYQKIALQRACFAFVDWREFLPKKPIIPRPIGRVTYSYREVGFFLHISEKEPHPVVELKAKEEEEEPRKLKKEKRNERRKKGRKAKVTAIAIAGAIATLVLLL